MADGVAISADVHESESGVPSALATCGAAVDIRTLTRGVCPAAAEQGVTLLRSEDPTDSAAWLYRLAVRVQLERRRRDRPPFAQIPKSPMRDRAAEAMLCAVPGISAVTAQALLSSFGTIAAVLVAAPDRWTAVPGMGPSRC